MPGHPGEGKWAPGGSRGHPAEDGSMPVSLLAALGPLSDKRARQAPVDATSALGQRSPRPPLLNQTPLLLPKVLLQELDQSPAGGEAGGLGRAQGWKAVPALSWPSRSFSILPFLGLRRAYLWQDWTQCANRSPL